MAARITARGKVGRAASDAIEDLIIQAVKREQQTGRKAPAIFFAQRLHTFLAIQQGTDETRR